jgi:hypothetical protein
MKQLAGKTTPTDPRSRRIRASRRGGHLLTRARSPSNETGLPVHVCLKTPLSRTVAPYSPPQTQHAPGAILGNSVTPAAFHTDHEPARTVARRGQTPHQGHPTLPRRDQRPIAHLGRARALEPRLARRRHEPTLRRRDRTPPPRSAADRHRGGDRRLAFTTSGRYARTFTRITGRHRREGPCGVHGSRQHCCHLRPVRPSDAWLRGRGGNVA